MLIQKKYIILPYNNRMTLKHLEFYDGGDLIFDFRIKLDFFTCECLAYINVEPYIGRDISIRFFASEENIATVYKGNIIKINNGLPILRRDTAQTRLRAVFL